MKAFPHQYAVWSTAGPSGSVAVNSAGLPTLDTAPPPEFDGPGDLWSPETLLVAAVVNCYVLTFRAIARASGLSWVSLKCKGDGVLDRVERVMRFTEITLYADLVVAPGTDEQQALGVMELSDKTCLITRSLATPTKLEATITEAESP